MLALMRYGAGLPMYRTGKWQNHFGVPLPASTQWELIEAASETPQVIYEALIGVAAQGQVLHNDDTHMRVQSVRKEIAAAGSEQERTGIFTTSIISKTGQRQIALFFTGQKHAGENLNQLLQRRAAGLDQPMQMCDALSRNEPKEFHTLLCHCLLHGRRQFVDVVENFPEECRKVIESLREVYRFDALAKEQKLSDLDRLAFHQAHSQPVMDDLQKWMQERVLGNSTRFTHKSTDFHFFQEMAICIQFSKSSANWLGVSSNIGSSGPGVSRITRARSKTAASASNDLLQVKRKLFKNTAPRPSWFFSYDWAGSIQGRTCCNNRWLTRVFIGINPSKVSCSAGL
jgi:hypothetical protein